jgi:prepilin-type N-terminal cleavage/methylation domain-containing protein
VPSPADISRSDRGFTLIELAVSMGILSVVSVLAMTVLVSTRNISKVVSWQSASNFELRQLIDNVLADVETARPAMGCDRDRDGRPDPGVGVTSACGDKMIETANPVLIMAGPNRICYYTNRLQSRTSAIANPPYAPVCVAVVGTSLRLEQFATPAAGDDWNQDITDGNKTAVPTVRVLGVVDPSPDGYFQYFQADPTMPPLVGTGSETVVGTTTAETDLLSEASRGLVNSVLLRIRLKLGTSVADSSHTRDVVYRITLRSTRYSAERCALGNEGANATTCSHTAPVVP